MIKNHKGNEVLVSGDGTRLWITDNEPHSSGRYNEKRSRVWVEVKNKKMIESVAKSVGLSSFLS